MDDQSKKPEAVALSDADRLSAIKLSAASFAEGDTLSQMAQSEAIKALSGATYAQWEGAATAWQTAYQSERAERNSPVDDKSAARAWQRLIKGAALQKPASPSPEAKAKSATRERNEAAEKMLGNLTDAALQESVESLRPFASEGMPRAVERMVTLKAEQTRRQKAREEVESQDTKKARAECVELLKTASHEVLMAVRGILKGELELPADVLAEFAPAPTLENIPLRTGTEG